MKTKLLSMCYTLNRRWL